MSAGDVIVAGDISNGPSGQNGPDWSQGLPTGNYGGPASSATLVDGTTATQTLLAVAGGGGGSIVSGAGSGTLTTLEPGGDAGLPTPTKQGALGNADPNLNGVGAPGGDAQTDSGAAGGGGGGGYLVGGSGGSGETADKQATGGGGGASYAHPELLLNAQFTAVTEIEASIFVVRPCIPVTTSGPTSAKGFICRTPLVFSYRGQPESFTVPTGDTLAIIDMYGAQGGDIGRAEAPTKLGGRGARVTSYSAVSSGQQLEVRVGGAGTYSPGSSFVRGGWNGGGYAAQKSGAASGGGASDVRALGGDAQTRIAVAGGGGAAATYYDWDWATGAYTYYYYRGGHGGLNGGDGEGKYKATGARGATVGRSGTIERKPAPHPAVGGQGGSAVAYFLETKVTSTTVGTVFR